MDDVMKLRSNKPLFMIDIAVPRDFDPAIGEADHILSILMIFRRLWRVTWIFVAARRIRWRTWLQEVRWPCSSGGLASGCQSCYPGIAREGRGHSPRDDGQLNE